MWTIFNNYFTIAFRDELQSNVEQNLPPLLNLLLHYMYLVKFDYTSLWQLFNPRC